MGKHPVLRAIAFLGLGFGGLIGGHAAGYAVAVPDVHGRAALLAHTGHGYLPSATWAAVMLGMAAVVAGIAAGYVRRPGHSSPSLVRVAPRLAVLQVLGFVTLEVVERLASGAALSTLSPAILVAGVMAQVLAALLIAVLVVGLRRAGEILRAVRTALVLPCARDSWPFGSQVSLPDFRLPAQILARAPPSALVV